MAVPITTNCAICGAAFSVKPGRFGKVLHCSSDCANMSKRKHPDSVCHACGKTFRPLARNGVGKFCSVACRVAGFRAMPEEDRRRIMAPAQSAVRGMKRSDADLSKRARTKQERAVLSGDESEIMAAYRASGLDPVPLYAVGKYNIDFAFPDRMVAVEYQGGNWHNTPTKRDQDAVKARFLTEQGWKLLIFARIKKTGVDEIVRQTVAALHS